MLRLMCLFCICLVTISMFCQSASNYQVATITAVKPHQPAGDSERNAGGYEVSLKAGNTIYVVLYTPPQGADTVKYAAGRDVLVLVGKKTITYNNILGESIEVPIISQKPAAEAKQSK
ncbi:MAG TPA: hypothetical protein VEG30_04580 [Terriglobales bacterium]|nr:hypothetical protein [Terriglobales bacterium]